MICDLTQLPAYQEAIKPLWIKYKAVLQKYGFDIEAKHSAEDRATINWLVWHLERD